jgi:hypothetical protein
MSRIIGRGTQARCLLLAEASLDLNLLGDLECVVDFHAQVTNGAFEFRVAQEQLDRPNIRRALVDDGRLRASK